jgi:hypothetical protein
MEGFEEWGHEASGCWGDACGIDELAGEFLQLLSFDSGLAFKFA